MLSSNSWKGFQKFSSINVYEVLDIMLKSRADLTTKAYIRVIRKFLDWSKSRPFKMQLPFPLSVVSLYLFEVQQSCASSSSVVLAYAALKVQLTPNLFFRLFKFPYFSDRHCEKIIVVAFFVNFL